MNSYIFLAESYSEIDTGAAVTSDFKPIDENVESRTESELNSQTDPERGDEECLCISFLHVKGLQVLLK